MLSFLSCRPRNSFLGKVISQFVGWQLLTPIINFEDIKWYAGIHNGLDTAAHDGDNIIETLIVVAVDPVEDVEAPIQGNRIDVEHDVGLGLPGLDDHHELGDEGHGLQVDGECPQNLHDTELVVDGQGQDQAGDDQKLDAERVILLVEDALK